MKRIATLFGAMMLPTLVAAQEIPILDEPPTKPNAPHKLLPSGLPDEMNCLCPRHIAARQNAPLQMGFSPAGVATLDSVPERAEIVKPLRLADLASRDSSENVGYKRFYALMRLKAHALECGANAIAQFAQTIEGDSLIFTATALRIERK
ncbi:MAG: hypothetical protein NZM06_08755 [Chloroherpetonaceae bacterium]|nr:hypothetical protein [Chloroherpetonaceae bacterium]MDW8436903.1 hypothetical protein [Chloroherpetonaceae bacterium]